MATVIWGFVCSGRHLDGCLEYITLLCEVFLTWED